MFCNKKESNKENKKNGCLGYMMVVWIFIFIIIDINIVQISFIKNKKNS